MIFKRSLDQQLNLPASTLRYALLALLLGASTFTASADSEYAAAWGPSVGTVAPLLAATDQDGNAHTLETLRGSNGLLFVFNRSVDW